MASHPGTRASTARQHVAGNQGTLADTVHSFQTRSFPDTVLSLRSATNDHHENRNCNARRTSPELRVPPGGPGKGPWPAGGVLMEGIAIRMAMLEIGERLAT